MPAGPGEPQHRTSVALPEDLRAGNCGAARSSVALLVAIAMAVGVAGTVVPLVPGLGLVVAAALVYGLVEGFGAVGVAAFVVIVLLGVA